MTAPDLPARLLAAIAEQERREQLKASIGLTKPSLLLSLYAAHREIVEKYLDCLRTPGPRGLAEAGAGLELFKVTRILARAYGLNPEETTA